METVASYFFGVRSATIRVNIQVSRSDRKDGRVFEKGPRLQLIGSRGKSETAHTPPSRVLVAHPGRCRRGRHGNGASAEPVLVPANLTEIPPGSEIKMQPGGTQPQISFDRAPVCNCGTWSLTANPQCLRAICNP